MKNSTTAAVLGVLGLCLAAWTAQAQPAPGQDGPPRGGRGFRGPPKEIVDKYDVNKDGVLDETERAALHQDVQDGKVQPPGRGPQGPPPEIVKQYDANNDGKLDDTERAALHKDIEEGKIQRPGRGPGGPGPNGPGIAPPSAKEIIAKFDGNQDGKLDETELNAFLNDMKQHRPPMGRGPRPGRGPFGPPPQGGLQEAPPEQQPQQ